MGIKPGAGGVAARIAICLAWEGGSIPGGAEGCVREGPVSWELWLICGDALIVGKESDCVSWGGVGKPGAAVKALMSEVLEAVTNGGPPSPGGGAAPPSPGERTLPIV